MDFNKTRVTGTGRIVTPLWVGIAGLLTGIGFIGGLFIMLLSLTPRT